MQDQIVHCACTFKMIKIIAVQVFHNFFRKLAAQNYLWHKLAPLHATYLSVTKYQHNTTPLVCGKNLCKQSWSLKSGSLDCFFIDLTTSLRRVAIAAIYFNAKTTESSYSHKISMTILREDAITATAYNPSIC